MEWHILKHVHGLHWNMDWIDKTWINKTWTDKTWINKTLIDVNPCFINQCFIDPLKIYAFFILHACAPSLTVLRQFSITRYQPTFRKN